MSRESEDENLETVFDGLPMNKKHYKYNLCKMLDAENNHAESLEFLDSVYMSPFDRPTNILFTDSLTSLKSLKNTLLKGWASCRSNVCLREGLTYFEFKISYVDFAKNCNTRLGVSQRCFPLGQPVGSDLYNSIGLRDMTFERLYNRKRDVFTEFEGENSVKIGDSIGFLVNLPSLSQQYTQIEEFINDLIAKETDDFELFHLKRYLEDLKDIYGQNMVHKERISIKYKNGTYFESQDYVNNELLKKEQYLKLEGAFVKVFQNGNFKGDLANEKYQLLTSFLPPFTVINYETARYKQLYHRLLKLGETKNIDLLIPRKYYDDGSLGYYPTVSLFNEAEVELNGSLNDMTYYDAVKQYVASDATIINKEIVTLEEVYQQQKAQSMQYDKLEVEKRESEYLNSASNDGSDHVADTENVHVTADVNENKHVTADVTENETVSERTDSQLQPQTQSQDQAWPREQVQSQPHPHQQEQQPGSLLPAAEPEDVEMAE